MKNCLARRRKSLVMIFMDLIIGDLILIYNNIFNVYNLDFEYHKRYYNRIVYNIL